MTFRIFDLDDKYSGIVLAEGHETIDELSPSGPIEQFYDKNGVIIAILRRTKVKVKGQ